MLFSEKKCDIVYPHTAPDGITRALGEGINVDFINNEKIQEFVITIWRENSNQVGNEVNITSNEVGKKSNQVGNEVATKSNQDEDVASNKIALTNKQKDIVKFCSVPRTTAEIMARLGVSNQTKNRERYVTSLVAAGYLEMTNPDNPTASNQKYRKVSKKNN